jgi:hypothetical protein
VLRAFGGNKENLINRGRRFAAFALIAEEM